MNEEQSGIRTVLVAVAMMRTADPVLGAAIELARDLDATLHVAHVFQLPGHTVDVQGYLGPDLRQLYAERVRNELEEQVAEHEPAGSVFLHAMHGSPGESMASLARTLGADLLVVGATRQWRPLRGLLGTTAERVIRTSPVPVLVLRAPLRRPLERVLMTTDLAGSSERVHEGGADMIEGLQLDGERPDVHCLLALWYGNGNRDRPGVTQIASEDLDRFLRRRSARRFPLFSRVRSGNPTEAITSEAREWDADLLVMGTQSRRGVERILHGSVAGDLLRDAPCNILVVPPRQAPLGRTEDSGASPAVDAKAVLPPVPRPSRDRADQAGV